MRGLECDVEWLEGGRVLGDRRDIVEMYCLVSEHAGRISDGRVDHMVI